MSIKAEHILEDAIEAAQDIHPALRRLRRPEPEEGQCAACGRWLLIAALTEDGLCHPCDEAVKELEQGIIR